MSIYEDILNAVDNYTAAFGPTTGGQKTLRKSFKKLLALKILKLQDRAYNKGYWEATLVEADLVKRGPS